MWGTGVDFKPPGLGGYVRGASSRFRCLVPDGECKTLKLFEKVDYVSHVRS